MLVDGVGVEEGDGHLVVVEGKVEASTGTVSGIDVIV